jgi:hypothetical protein
MPRESSQPRPAFMAAGGVIPGKLVWLFLWLAIVACHTRKASGRVAPLPTLAEIWETGHGVAPRSGRPGRPPRAGHIGRTLVLPRSDRFFSGWPHHAPPFGAVRCTHLGRCLASHSQGRVLAPHIHMCHRNIQQAARVTRA